MTLLTFPTDFYSLIDYTKSDVLDSIKKSFVFFGEKMELDSVESSFIFVFIAVTIISAIFSYIFTYFFWAKQRNNEKQNIAVGFYHEIAEIHDTINPIVEYFEKFREPKLTGTWKLNDYRALTEAIIETNVYLNKYSSLYDKDGLFYLFRDGIYLFDLPLVKSLLNFYGNLLKADTEYKRYMNCTQGIYPDIVLNPLNKAANPEIALLIQYPFIMNLDRANKEVPKAILLLKRYINKDE
jgi:hypothetical protein